MGKRAECLHARQHCRASLQHNASHASQCNGSICAMHEPGDTCYLQLIHWNSPIPGIQAMVHAEGLDDVDSCLANAWRCLRHDKGLHLAILTFNYVHLDSHPVGALLTSAAQHQACLARGPL